MPPLPAGTVVHDEVSPQSTAVRASGRPDRRTTLAATYCTAASPRDGVCSVAAPRVHGIDERACAPCSAMHARTSSCLMRPACGRRPGRPASTWVWVCPTILYVRTHLQGGVRCTYVRRPQHVSMHADHRQAAENVVSETYVRSI